MTGSDTFSPPGRRRKSPSVLRSSGKKAVATPALSESAVEVSVNRFAIDQNLPLVDELGTKERLEQLALAHSLQRRDTTHLALL